MNIQIETISTGKRREYIITCRRVGETHILWKTRCATKREAAATIKWALKDYWNN